MEFNKARVSLSLAFVLLAGILFSGLSAAMPATTDVVVAKSHDSDDDSDVSKDALPHFNSVSQAVAYIASHKPQKDKVWTVFINEGIYRERVVKTLIMFTLWASRKKQRLSFSIGMQVNKSQRILKKNGELVALPLWRF
ncbi:MAG: hypothetical protein VX459_12975 [Pseudomonadota bacterium]|nr:hypothetical protein [Pseudomonadota bacterium]